MRITLATIDAKTGKAQKQFLEVPEGSTVGEALKGAHIPFNKDALGLWTQKVTPETKLTEGDRIDLGSELWVDRTEARRLRAESSQHARLETIARHGGKHQLKKI